MRRGDNLEPAGLAIGFVSAWAGILYFLVEPLAALGWLAFWVVAGLAGYAFYRQETKNTSLEDIRILVRQREREDALRCTGRVPHDRHYEKAGRSA